MVDSDLRRMNVETGLRPVSTLDNTCTLLNCSQKKLLTAGKYCRDKACLVSTLVKPALSESFLNFRKIHRSRL